MIQIHILITGNGTKEVSQNIQETVPGTHANKIFTFTADHPYYFKIFRTADVIGNLVENLITKNGYKRFLGLSSSIGKDVIPRVAGKY